MRWSAPYHNSYAATQGWKGGLFVINLEWKGSKYTSSICPQKILNASFCILVRRARRSSVTSCERVNAVARLCRADMQHSSPIEAVCCYGEKTQSDVILAQCVFFSFFPSLLRQFDLREELRHEYPISSSFLLPYHPMSSGTIGTSSASCHLCCHSSLRTSSVLVSPWASHRLPSFLPSGAGSASAVRPSTTIRSDQIFFFCPPSSVPLPPNTGCFPAPVRVSSLHLRSYKWQTESATVGIVKSQLVGAA